MSTKTNVKKQTLLIEKHPAIELLNEYSYNYPFDFESEWIPIDRCFEKLIYKGPNKGWTKISMEIKRNFRIKYNKEYKNGFATFSVPLFSLDRKICVVYKAGHCGGLCGHGGKSVCKKVNGKWTFLKSIGVIWIS